MIVRGSFDVRRMSRSHHKGQQCARPGIVRFAAFREVRPESVSTIRMARSRFRKRRRSRRPGRIARRWDTAENLFVIEHYVTMKAREIGARLDRTKSAVIAHAGVLGVQKRFPHPWTKKELTRLKRMYRSLGPAATAKALGRTRYSIFYAAVRGKLMNQRRVWTKREDALLRKYAPTHTARQLARIVGWGQKATSDRLFRLGAHSKLANTPWTAAQLRYLRENYATTSNVQLSQKVGKAPTSIVFRAQRLGLRKKIQRMHWTPEMENVVRQGYIRRAPQKDMAKQLGVSITAVENVARRLGITRPAADYWTLQEDNTLKANAGVLAAREIAKRIGKSGAAVLGRAGKLGISLRVPSWSKKELAILHARYRLEGGASIARELKRSLASVHHAAKKHGLRVQTHVRYPSWTAREEAFIRAHAGQRLAEDIARDLKRTTNAVRLRAIKLGVPLTRTFSLTPAQQKFVRAHFTTMTYRQLGAALKISWRWIQRFAGQQGLRKQDHHAWTPAEDKKLRAMYGTVSTREIARRFRKTMPAIAGRATNLGIRKPVGRYTDAEEALIAKMYGTHTLEEIGKRVGRSRDAIRGKITLMGLRKKGR
jgi:hypothetical protein